VLALLSACGEPATGPVAIGWDRDVCDRCGMTLSDRRFGAQLRLADTRGAHRFDDLGCALVWLDEQASDEPPVELWVRDLGGEQWLDAAGAAYRDGQQSPMGYGFGAVTQASDETLRLDEVRLRVLETERERRAAPR
jgi:hypothetical protein